MLKLAVSLIGLNSLISRSDKVVFPFSFAIQSVECSSGNYMRAFPPKNNPSVHEVRYLGNDFKIWQLGGLGHFRHLQE